MLLDNKQKAVEFFVENILSGTVTVDLLKLAKLLGYEHVPTTGKDEDALDDMVNVFLDWIKLRKDKPQSKEFMDSTDMLFGVLIRSRLFGFVSGVFKEISELEHALTKSLEDNRDLASAYKEQARIIATYEAGMHKQK